MESDLGYYGQPSIPANIKQKKEVCECNGEAPQSCSGAKSSDVVFVKYTSHDGHYPTLH